MKKKWLIIPLVILLLSPLVFADFGSSLGNIFDGITSIGNLNFLGVSDSSAVTGLTRILLWVLVFTILFASCIITLGPTGNLHHLFTRGQAGVVGAVMATIASIFLPVEVIIATGSTWGTIIALALLGGPIIGFLYLLFTYPEGEETRVTLFLKLIVCLILYWILTAMKYHVGRIL